MRNNDSIGWLYADIVLGLMIIFMAVSARPSGRAPSPNAAPASSQNNPSAANPTPQPTPGGLNIATESVLLDFRAGAKQSAVIQGMYEAEVWGTWTATDRVTIRLNQPLSGQVCVRLATVLATKANQQRQLNLEIGTQLQSFVLEPNTRVTLLKFNLTNPSDTLKLTDLLAVDLPSAGRRVGIGLETISITHC